MSAVPSSYIRRKRLGDVLLAHKLVTREQLEKAADEQRKTSKPLGQILVSMGAITPKSLLKALAAQKGVSPWHLDEDPPNQTAVRLIGVEVCRKLQVVPVRWRGDLLVLAMEDTDDISLIEKMREATNLRIEPVLADRDALTRTIRKLLDGNTNTATGMSNLVAKAVEESNSDTRQVFELERTDLNDDEDRPVAALANTLLTDAIRAGASDIHFEPKNNRVEVRMRIDGELVFLAEIPGQVTSRLLTRLKIMVGVDIVDNRTPQDGRSTFELDNREVDVRASVWPSVHGSRIVLRLLDRSLELRNTEELGFSTEQSTQFLNMVSRPYGLVLVTGPTGAGKTTTLYAGINYVKSERINVMTVEDPVEYEIQGTSQSQINEKIGLTFAEQLRAVLRQDPDVVLVGEIRDKDTAETALRASMTGHLVLSTLHTNSAIDTIPRLVDVGLDPYLLSTSLVGATAQRLLKTLCKDCCTQETPNAQEQDVLRTLFGSDPVAKVWHPVGCAKCSGTGYKGRRAVHEVFTVNPAVSRLIAERASADVVRAAAELNGYKPMEAQALDLVLSGRTTIAEAKRVLAFDHAMGESWMPQAA